MATHATKNGLQCDCGSHNLTVIRDEQLGYCVMCKSNPNVLPHRACRFDQLQKVIEFSSLIPNPSKTDLKDSAEYVIDEQRRQEYSLAVYTHLVSALDSDITDNPTNKSDAIQKLQSILLTSEQLKSLTTNN